MSQCNNCNFQNSLSEYSSNESLLNNKIKPPRRRYNPGVTSKAEKLTNLKTLKAAENVMKVDTQIRASDEINEKKIRAKSSSSQVILNQDDKKKGNVNAAVIRARRYESTDKVFQRNEDKITKQKQLRLLNISVGTSLASSKLYKTQFDKLKPIVIKKDKAIDLKLPVNFDGRKVWNIFFKPIRNQGLCGSCWAFASLFVLQTRLAIYSNGLYNYSLSPAKLVLCNQKSIFDEKNAFDYITDTKKKGLKNLSCNGETLIGSWQFLFRYGSPEDDCVPYGDTETENIEVNLTIKDEIDENMCEQMLGSKYDTCKGKNIPMISHKAGGYYFVNGVAPEGSEYNIRKDIYRWGPTTSGMIVYEDLINWSGKGVYKWDGKSEIYGGHAVVIVGWGETNNEKYWIIRNSWGNTWGDKGYFKILRGENHCEIEENVFTGIPNIPSLRYFIDQPLYFQEEDHIYKYLWGIYDNGLKRTTLEDLVLGKLQPGTLSFKDIYDIRKFPNFKNFVAGITSSESFYIINHSIINIFFKFPYLFLFLFSFLFIKYGF